MIKAAGKSISGSLSGENNAGHLPSHLQSERPAEFDCQFQKRLCIFFIIISERIWGSCSRYDRILIFKNMLQPGVTEVVGMTNPAKGARSV